MKRDNSMKHRTDDRISELFDDCVKILNSARDKRQRYSAMTMVKATIDIAVSEKARLSKLRMSERFLIEAFKSDASVKDIIKDTHDVLSEALAKKIDKDNLGETVKYVNNIMDASREALQLLESASTVLTVVNNVTTPITNHIRSGMQDGEVARMFDDQLANKVNVR